ncbi:LytTR family DNA-binding domain-containing protein [Neolewinella litorea]|uniref:HTH LytTR-type domain-containing protein n=1 Tax=Neolewinella litorea TaxID=2562452 RepID=A0A4S4NKG5_9BACT|nr:LytTR family DNA-binding domain-containing protein [Neolewinella litorea]THH40289.1 hypothetical protein E4021_06005 [Neolewinella litorea]
MLSRNPFRRPFPERPFGRGVMIGHARTALFVFLALLFLFSPLLALAYGLTTLVVALAYHYLTERLGVRRTGRKWTMFRWTLDQATLLLLVSVACFILYNATVGWTVLNVRVLLYITVPTVLVGLLPIIVSGVAVQLRAEGEHQRVAGRVQLASLGGSPAAGQVVFGEKASTETNTVHYRNGVSEEVIHSLQSLADRYRREGIVRCHRDYVVNKNCIVGVSADAQGLRLRLVSTEQQVPVSPDYFPAIG